MVDINRIDRIVDRWNADPEFVIEMFQDIQGELRHIPREALERVSYRTGAARGNLFHIATFYRAFSLEPRGEYNIQVCMGTCCFARGGADLLAAMERELGVEIGETTEDGRFSLEIVRCLGCCSQAPVVAVNDEIVSSVRPSEVAEFLAQYR